jgi:hypothetical protein
MMDGAASRTIANWVLLLSTVNLVISRTLTYIPHGLVDVDNDTS